MSEFIFAASSMHTPVLGALILFYIAAIGFLGWRGWKKTANQRDYLLAGREVHPFVMAMSYGAAFISTSALVGFGGIAGQFGLGLLWLVFMNIFIGIFVAFVFFGYRTRRMGKVLNANTFPEFIGKRFRSSNLKILVSLIIFGFVPLYSSVVLIGGARFLEEVMMIDYSWSLAIFAAVVAVYVIFGGLKGVMYVDALMGSVMIGGMLLLLVMCFVKLGGVSSAFQALTDMAPLVKERLPDAYALGHRGWTVMPETNSVWWWTLVSSLMLGVGIGALAQPQLAVRLQKADGNTDIALGLRIHAVAKIAIKGLPIIFAEQTISLHQKQAVKDITVSLQKGDHSLNISTADSCLLGCDILKHMALSRQIFTGCSRCALITNRRPPVISIARSIVMPAQGHRYRIWSSRRPSKYNCRSSAARSLT